MTGVEDVNSFDEIQIIAKTCDADISIEGEELKIEKFDCESGNLTVKGRIDGLNYYNTKSQKKKKTIMNLFK
jgi:sporulation protein YabP